MAMRLSVYLLKPPTLIEDDPVDKLAPIKSTSSSNSALDLVEVPAPIKSPAMLT